MQGGKLLYVSNTETPWCALEDNKMYILLSVAGSAPDRENGPWEFVRPISCPPAFKDIAPGPDIGVRTSGGRTAEADDAPARHGDPADDGDEARRGEVRVAVRRRADRADPRHDVKYATTPAQSDRRQVLRCRQRGGGSSPAAQRACR